jgi:hypothetical protein
LAKACARGDDRDHLTVLLLAALQFQQIALAEQGDRGTYRGHIVEQDCAAKTKLFGQPAGIYQPGEIGNGR